MTHTLIIAEAGSSHDNDLQKAYRLIEAAKECGADAVKFQWTSDGNKMSLRRGLKVGGENMYSRWLEKPVSWLESLKAHADKVGIEFMCTVYLIEDIATIAPLVKRFKVSAFERNWLEFFDAHWIFNRQIIASTNTVSNANWSNGIDYLYCVSKYPTPLEELHLGKMSHGKTRTFAGLSDHTTSTLTGALAVAAGATIIEKHIRLHDTDPKNPDYGHSLEADEIHDGGAPPAFWDYVRNIREAERAM